MSKKKIPMSILDIIYLVSKKNEITRVYNLVISQPTGTEITFFHLNSLKLSNHTINKIYEFFNFLLCEDDFFHKHVISKISYICSYLLQFTNCIEMNLLTKINRVLSFIGHATYTSNNKFEDYLENYVSDIEYKKSSDILHSVEIFENIHSKMSSGYRIKFILDIVSKYKLYVHMNDI